MGSRRQTKDPKPNAGGLDFDSMKNMIDIIVKIAYLKDNLNKFNGLGGIPVEVNKKSKTA